MSACCVGICDIFTRRNKNGRLKERENFEKTILFLASVPLFKKQLPKAELPVLAQRLTERRWPPGKTLIKQSELGRTFFLIFSGRASVMTQTDDGKFIEHAVLSEGDWLGGHALTSERPNVATVVAKGPETLVTLEMSKRDFEQSGLKSKLQFSKRPAMCLRAPEVESALGMAAEKGGAVARADTREEQDFVMQAISRNPNMCFMSQLDNSFVADPSTAMREMAAAAQRRKVVRGTEVARRGDLGQEFFVIREGSFEVVVDNSTMISSSSAQHSAESAVASFSLAERLRRKQNFLTQLHQPIGEKAVGAKAFSMLAMRAHLPDPWGRQNNHEAEIVGHSSFKSPGGQQKKNRSISSFASPRGGDSDVVAILHKGESFGELSLLYNTRREATFRAAEDAEVYVISRREFKQFTGRSKGTTKFQECFALLDEVDSLAPLLRAERKELATNLSDFVTFRAGERILTQGKVRKSAMWYVVYSGSAILFQDDPNAPNGRRDLGEITRGAHFGESTSMTRDDSGAQVMQMNIDAGPQGLTCATFDGELVQELFRGMASVEDTHLSNEKCDAVEYERRKMSRLHARKTWLNSVSHLQEVCVLGRGGFGIVFLAKDAEKKLYAVKRISKGHAKREEIIQQLCWEKDLLSMIDSPFIVKLLGTCRDEQFVYLIMEAALGGDLYRLFHKHPEVFTDDSPRGAATQFYTACIILGLEHLHERRILYRDLKPENLLLDVQGYGKICDMGLARFVVGKTNTQVGTPDYMAPEIIDPPHYHDFSADWWALGVLAFELLNRQTPFYDDGREEMQDRVLAIRRSQETDTLRFVYSCPSLAKGFIQRLLRKLPGRLGADGGAAEVRQHSWFRSFDFDALRARTMPAPMQLVWEEPMDTTTPQLHKVPDEENSLFEQYVPEGDDWDAIFAVP